MGAGRRIRRTYPVNVITLRNLLSEACEAYLKKKDDLGEELADVVIYLLGLSEILGIDLEKELLAKIEKNDKRQYINRDGIHIKISQ